MKHIFYPGNSLQPCLAQYAIALSKVKELATAQILFVELSTARNIGATFCSFGDVPDFLVNKVIADELSGCRLDFIECYYAGLPDEGGRRPVSQWILQPDTFDLAMRGGSCDAVIYASFLDKIKARFLGGVTPIAVHANSYQLRGGVCRVKIIDVHHGLPEDQRIKILNKFDVI
ncbi:hypothetical protein HQN60_15785 (plasmid) [Deefgea piscis]|uniref:Uncharacterized protein n=1 Tax=Deefgea piscis TaxID=2739061 RepID=A0A6M8SSH4_9NEIS|nr:hypothetical protein [Deefgea piscis]QKJ68272.1 hypothetical protein HQN60_15785 [Deefgea piscis]